jgi:DNA polymerase III delta prime subunit
MAYGKKNVISTDLSRLIFGLLGEPGIGKTTTIYQMAEKEFGEDGYLLLDVGSEWGSEYINGVVAEQTETFKKFLDVTNDIIKNKDKEYPNLKVVILDTIDALFEIGEPYLVKLYNQEHMGEKNFKPASTINAAEGGFMKGQDRLIEIVIDQLVKLRKVGVGFWYTGHVKRRSNDDAFSGETYDMITTNMSQRYFAAIRNKSHAIGIAYIDRTLTQQEVGKENPITKEKKTITRVVSESRKVKFRDDSYTADSKSRLESIAEEVLLDTDELLKALKDAISAANGKPSAVKPNKPAPAPVAIEEDGFDQEDMEMLAMGKEDDDIPFDTDEPEVEEPTPIKLSKARLTAIREAFRSADADTKKEVKKYLANYDNKLADEMLETDVVNIEPLLQI